MTRCRRSDSACGFDQIQPDTPRMRPVSSSARVVDLAAPVTLQGAMKTSRSRSIPLGTLDQRGAGGRSPCAGAPPALVRAGRPACGRGVSVREARWGEQTKTPARKGDFRTGVTCSPSYRQTAEFDAFRAAPSIDSERPAIWPKLHADVGENLSRAWRGYAVQVEVIGVALRWLQVVDAGAPGPAP